MTATAYDATDLTAGMIKACEDMTSLASGYVGAATKSSAAAWQGIDDLTRNMGSLFQESMTRSLGLCQTLMSAKSPTEAAETHAEYMKTCFDGLVAGGSKISEISLHTAKGAIEPLAQHANASMETIMKKAKAG